MNYSNQRYQQKPRQRFQNYETYHDNQDMIQQLITDTGRAKLMNMSELNVQIFNAYNVKSQDIFVINATR